MARENPFAKLDMASIASNQTPTKPGYGMTGAAKTVVRSIEDLAENTKKLMEGEVIVDLDPRVIDVSFVADRLSDDGEEYQELKQAISESGQTTPILVRPSSSDSQRFMVVFGHRRLRVAKELGVPVKAVVKKWTTSRPLSHRGRKIPLDQTCRSSSVRILHRTCSRPE